MMNEINTHIIIFVANEADESFVSSLLSYYQENSSKPIKKWDVFNLKGIKRRTQRIENKISTLKSQYAEDPQIVVFTFCSNNALYPFCEKPVIDWDNIKRVAKNQSVHDFHEIVVDDIIEDWILDDLNGLCDCLGIDEPDVVEGENGYQKVSILFRKACKQYISRYSILDVLPYLNLEKIRCKRKRSLYELEELLDINC
jgi:hypothetical protein